MSPEASTGILDPLRDASKNDGDATQWSATVLLDGTSPTVLDDLDGDLILPTASIGKLFVLLTVLDEIEEGRLGPADVLDVTDDDQVADSGLLQFLDEQSTPVLDLCRFVGAVSDNLATNMLIRRVGLDRIDELTRRLGIASCRLHDTVRDARTADEPPFLSTGSSAELADLARRIRIGHAISPTVSEALVELLRRNTDLSMVAAAFGLDPLAHADEDIGIGLRLFNKTGTQTGTRADVGCVETTVAGEWRVVSYAVIARFDDSPSMRRNVLGAMRAVGERILAQL